MPTPTFALRLEQKTQDDIATLSKLYGAPNPRAFAREILEVVTGGDMGALLAFAERLTARIGGQTAFVLPVDTRAPSHGAPVARKPAKGRKRRRPRDRTT